MTTSVNIAFFITPHGFGHAGRAAAVMNALLEVYPGFHFELFTTVPRIFFALSGLETFGYHALDNDVGLVQLSPLREDLTATCNRLDQMLPFDHALTTRLAEQLKRLDCRLVICDIAAMGIAAASKAGRPGVLVENFTWDWIYSGYAPLAPRLKTHIEYLSAIYRQADHHIQTEPLCSPGNAALTVGPIGREPRTPASQIRSQLGIADSAAMVLVSMGGVGDQFEFLDSLPADLDFTLVIPGADGRTCNHNKVILLPTYSGFYHPDLMGAADVLIGKAGYSTIAEAYLCGVPFGFVMRARSPESAVLETFITRHLPSRAIAEEAYAAGDWINTAMDLLGRPGPSTDRENGARQVARYLCRLLSLD